MAVKKILIVDYDSKSLDHLARLFEPYKFEIIKATDGEAGYDNFVSENPDLVILEAMLPKLHGFDLAQRISQEAKGKTPVIIVTGLYRGPQFRTEAFSYLGVSDYFEKPFDEVRLVKSALNLLNKREEIKEKLPMPDSVIKEKPVVEKKEVEPPPAKEVIKEKPVVDEKEVEPPPAKEVIKEKPVVEKKEAKPSPEIEWDASTEKALSEIEVNTIEEISSLLDVKKRKKDRLKKEKKESEKK